jgi:hypothetical protein
VSLTGAREGGSVKRISHTTEIHKQRAGKSCNNSSRLFDFLWENLPKDIQFHLSPMAVNPMDLPVTITFTSEAGYKIWVTQQDQTLQL